VNPTRRKAYTVADADGVYDPTEHSDRLLLGLHGVMNEAELRVLKQRMYQGKLNKARRGELLGLPPIGYLRVPTGEWVIDPDEQVQAVVRLIFDQFDREATMHGLLRFLVHHQVRIPVRLAGGPSKGQLEWRRPNRATLQNLLRHPSYAGAYRFGHRPVDPRKKQPGRPNTGKLIRRPEECLVLIRDRLPAYITWERFEANQKRLTANRNLPGTPGAPRHGPAVLAGLVRCGRCGRRLVVRYSGPKNYPTYTCTRGSADYGEPLCQGLSNGTALDELVAHQLLAAVEPAALEASLAAVAGVERQRAELTRQWHLKRERAAIAVDRAARQYQACEPENRLVARELERRWEEALKAQRQLDDAYDRFVRSAPAELSDSALSAIRALAADLSAVWSAATTTPADRQRIARLLLERVVVTVDKASERVDVMLHWVGGAVRPHHHRPPGDTLQPAVGAPAVGHAVAGVVWRATQRDRHRGPVECRRVLPAEANEPVYAGHGAAPDGPPGAGPAAAAREFGGTGPGRIPADEPGEASGHQPGYRPTLAASRVAFPAARRRRASRDLGGRR
jgi:Recombinase/Recombinase zinc beta ribbon domain